MARSYIDISATFKPDYKINDLLWKSILQDRVPGQRERWSPLTIFMCELEVENKTAMEKSVLREGRRNIEAERTGTRHFSKGISQILQELIQFLVNSEFRFLLEAWIGPLHLKNAKQAFSHVILLSLQNTLEHSQRQKSILMNI